MVAVRRDTGISSEHFLYNENNLTHCSTQRNSPPIPQSSPPPPPLHYHIKAWVQSKSSLSRVGARHTVGEGRGRDQGSESRPKPEFAFILLQCVYVQKTLCICESVDTSAWLLVGERNCRKISTATRVPTGFSTNTEEKSIQIPETTHNEACRGSDRAAEKCQSRYMVQ